MKTRTLDAGGFGPACRKWAAVLAAAGLFQAVRLLAEGAPLPVDHNAPVSQEGLCLVWQPDAGEDLLAVAEFLQARPSFRVSAVLPDSVYGDDERAQKARKIFQELIALKRMEVVLTVPGDPVLALIEDTDAARAPDFVLPPRFSWPDDVVGQLSLAWNNHRRRWQSEPQGLAMPYGVINGLELPLIEKVRIKWVLVKASTQTNEAEPDAVGYFRGVPLAVVRPHLFPSGAASDKRDWIYRWRSEALVPAPLRLRHLSEFQALEDLLGDVSGHKILFVSEALSLRKNLPHWTGTGGFVDFSPWIGQTQENLAWQLLGMTRQAVEDYKNSGQADVAKLDSALREIYAAESGRYFYAFGSDTGAGNQKELEQDFLATLAQVYRIIGKPVPAALLQGDTKSGVDTLRPPESTLTKGDNELRWTDLTRDDRGPGDYFYPTGKDYLPGSWDMQSFTVRWTEKEVVFSFQMGSLPNFWRAPYGFSYPLVDVYIDINRLPGAGSEILLPGRPGLVEPADAWEFALSVDGWGGRLYRSSYGQAPKVLARLPVKIQPVSPVFELTVPRVLLRGDPAGWGYGVSVLGCEPPKSGAADAECRPMRVMKDPGAYNFGSPGVKDPSAQAPPFIDILAPKGVTQNQVLDVYLQGRDVVLPFLRGE